MEFERRRRGTHELATIRSIVRRAISLSEQRGEGQKAGGSSGGEASLLPFRAAAWPIGS